MTGDQDIHYNVLRVPRDASPEEIRQAYFDAARKYHPDVNASLDSSELFLKIKHAYELLSHKERRKKYDLTLRLDDPVTPDVKLDVQFGRSALLNVKEPQLVYLIAELHSTLDAANARRTPLNLNIAIDRSTSMNGRRLDTIKENIHRLLKILRPTDMISVVAFSDTAEVIIPPTRLSDQENLGSKVASIRTGGGTEIYQGLLAGIKEIKRHLNPGSINHLILLTDGHTYGDEQDCLKISEDAAESGIGISGLGIGADWNDEFLDRLSATSGSSSYYLSSGDDLEKYLADKLNLFEKIYAERLVLELELPGDVELKYGFKISPENGPFPISNRMRIGAISYADPCRFGLELIVKKVPKSGAMHLLKGKIFMEVLSRRIPYARLNFDANLSLESDTIRSTVNQAALNDFSHISLYRLQERARREIAAGDIPTGTRHLQSFATNLYSQGEQEFAHSVLKEAEFIQGNQKYTAEGDKKIKYHTRALLLPG